MLTQPVRQGSHDTLPFCQEKDGVYTDEGALARIRILGA